ncbi:MAG: hypothetical protein PHV74_09820 [Dehalococcoidia bacterium]|nr:hypothetical protein [Dehalococcoidia bacterium]
MAHRKFLVLLFIILISVMTIPLPGCDSSDKTTLPSVSPTTVTVPASISPCVIATLSPGTDLKFEKIVEPERNIGFLYREDSAQIRVITSAQTPLPEEIEWVNAVSQTKILTVDYSEYFVVMVFNGYRSGISSNLKVQGIWQSAGAICVLAHFNDYQPDATSLSNTNSQYEVVKISRAQLSQHGEIVFVLSDETGNERARTTQMVLQNEPQGTNLNFDDVVEPGEMGWLYKGESAQIQVITTTQDPLPEALEWIDPDARTAILEVDYSRYFVIMVFNGYRGGIFSYLRIHKIWQSADVVYVLAQLPQFRS